MAAPPVEILDEIRHIDGFVLACLIDGASGMVLESVSDQGSMSVPVAAAGATDVVNVLSLMTGELGLEGDLEDVIITLGGHYHLIRMLAPGPAGQLILFTTLDRSQANLGMARHEIRDVSARLA